MSCKLTVDQLAQLVALADAHRESDEYIAGTYEKKNDGKWQGGCAIGCVVHDAVKIGVLPEGTSAYGHCSLSEASGIPTDVWYLVEAIFEGLSEEERAAWTPMLLRAIKFRADYSQVGRRMKIFCLKECRANARPDGQSVIDRCIVALEKELGGGLLTEIEWNEIVEAARSAARSAAAAAAESAESAAAAFSRYRDELLRLMNEVNR